MLYLTYSPRFPLSRFMSFWYAENVPQHAFEQLLPTGEMDIVFNLRDAVLQIYGHSDLRKPQRFTGPILSGAHSKCYVVDTCQQASLLGVKFLPGGAYPFISDPADHFQNRQVALADLWGQTAAELQARLMEAGSPAVRFRLLEQALLDRFAQTLPSHPAVARAVAAFAAQGGAASVTAVARDCGLSARRFIELFRREVGLPPKTYCRVLRFQRALRLIQTKPPPDFSRLAFECGYYDQAHLIRDFNDFAEMAPTAYLARRGVHYSHVIAAPIER